MTAVAKAAKRHAPKIPKKRHRPMLLVKRFPQDLYGRCVTFLYGSVDDANRWFQREMRAASADWTHTPLRGCCNGHWKMLEVGGYQADYIFLRRDTGPIAELASLAHETLHHVGHALRMNGLPWTEESEEAYTYYQQFMIRQCLSAIRGRHRGRA
jgi:hypothetical protein